MGSECKQGKFRYDLTMSKRTRKPLNCEQESDQSSLSSEKDIPRNGVNDSSEAEDENCDHQSLKQVIKGRHTLGQYFTEEASKQPMIVIKQIENGVQEKQLQIVVKNHEGSNKVKLKKMATQCTKILKRLIRNKRDSHTGSKKIMAIQ